MIFSYDSTKLQPSNIETNQVTDDEMQYFKFEDEFADSLEMFTVPYIGTEDVIRAIISFDPPVNESEHIIEKEGIGKVITTQDRSFTWKNEFSNDIR